MSANANFTVAIHILTFLAGQSEPSPSAFIAESLNAHPVTVRRMVSRLREAGVVETVAGSAGGAQLSKAAAAITLGQVYGIVKEEMPFGLHAQPPCLLCPIGRNIEQILSRIFHDLDGIIAAALMKITIQDIVDEVWLREGQR